MKKVRHTIKFYNEWLIGWVLREKTVEIPSFFYHVTVKVSKMNVVFLGEWERWK